MPEADCARRASSSGTVRGISPGGTRTYQRSGRARTNSRPSTAKKSLSSSSAATRLLRRRGRARVAIVQDQRVAVDAQVHGIGAHPQARMRAAVAGERERARRGRPRAGPRRAASQRAAPHRGRARHRRARATSPARAGAAARIASGASAGGRRSGTRMVSGMSGAITEGARPPRSRRAWIINAGHAPISHFRDPFSCSPSSSSSAFATRAPSAATTSSRSSRSSRCSGIALGIAALITVMSVMNGFETEIRTRILGVAAHMQVLGVERGPRRLAARSRPRRRQSRGGRRAAPFVRGAGAALLRRAGARRLRARRACRSSRTRWPTFGAHMRQRQPRGPASPASSASCWARSSRAGCACRLGDRVTLIAPQGQVTPAGLVPRLKQFTRGRHLLRRALRVRLGPRAHATCDDAQVLYRLGDAA